jgi:hypothetical protein
MGSIRTAGLGRMNGRTSMHNGAGADLTVRTSDPMIEAARLEAEGYRLLAEGHALLARAARLRAELPASAAAGDSLVAIAESGLDARACRRLEAEGLLPVRKVGRRKYTTRSALVALVTSTTSSTARVPTHPETPEEAANRMYDELVARTRFRTKTSR